jgi:hypothetical protein
MRPRTFTWLIILPLLLLASGAFADLSVNDFTVEGRLYDSNGVPINSTSLYVTLELIDESSANCVIYSETFANLNVSSTDPTAQGVFALRLGTGTQVFPTSGTRPNFYTLFSSGAFAGVDDTTAAVCSFSAAASDHRLVRIKVSNNGGSSYETLSPDTLVTSVPTAMVAQTLQGYQPSNFLLTNINTSLTQPNLENVFSPTNFPVLLALLGGTSTQYVGSGTNGAENLPQVSGSPVSPTAGQIWYDAATNVVKYYNGTAVQSLGSGGGGVTSITAGTGLSGGTITSSGSLAVNVGTGANQIVQLNASSQLPALDGSLLTNVNSSKLATRSVASVAPASNQILGWNNTSSSWQPASINSAMISSSPIATNQLLISDATTGTTLTYATCLVGQLMTYTATGWSCSSASSALGSSGVTAGAYGGSTQVAQTTVDGAGRITTLSNVNIAFPVTSVNGKTGVVTLNGADLGLGSASLLSSGTAANNALQLNAAAQIPAVNGSLLTNVNAAALQGSAVSSNTPANGQGLVWNSTSSSWQPQNVLSTSGNFFGTNIFAGTVDPFNLAFITNSNVRMTLTSGGSAGIGVPNPSAVLHLKAGGAVSGSSPLKFSSGSILITPEAGAFEYDGSNLYFTDGTATRRTLAATGSVIMTPQIFGSPNNIKIDGNSVGGNVLLASGTPGTVGINNPSPSPNVVLDINGPTNFGGAYFENLTAMGTLSCGISTVAYTINIYSLTACASGTTSINLPLISGWPAGSKVWNVTFFVTGQTSSIFNVGYNGGTANVFWDKNSTGSAGGSGYGGFPVANGHTSVISCAVMSSGMVYCGVAAQY